MIVNNNEEIKRELYRSYLILVRNMYQQSEPDRNTPQIGAIRKRFLVGSVTFLALAMESFINDFGDRLVDDFEDFEKMDSLNKFLIFPKIARMNPTVIINKSEAPYAALKLLFRYRNFFVHYKPAFRTTNAGDERIYEELDHRKVKDLYKRMVELLRLFNNTFLIFEGENDWITSYSEDIASGT
jgi:hypothetical protein